MFQAQFTLAALAFALTLHAQTADPVRHFIEALTIPSDANPAADPAFEKQLMALADLIPVAPAAQIAGYLPLAGGVLAKGGPGQREVVLMLWC